MLVCVHVYLNNSTQLCSIVHINMAILIDCRSSRFLLPAVHFKVHAYTKINTVLVILYHVCDIDEFCVLNKKNREKTYTVIGFIHFTWHFWLNSLLFLSVAMSISSFMYIHLKEFSCYGNIYMDIQHYLTALSLTCETH